MYDMQTSKYFNSLSVPVQEKIRECGQIFNSDEELRGYVANLNYM